MTGIVAVTDDGFRLGLLVSAFGFGLRHGVDWDHIAAIGDLTGGGAERRRSLVLATLYALGHAAVVVALGSLAIVAGDYLPPAVDAIMGRVVGVTLLILGGYVLYGLARHGREFRMRSRWTLLAAPLRRLRRPRPVEIVEHDHDHSHNDGGTGHGHLHSGHTPAGVLEHGPGEHVGLAVATKVRHHHRHVHAGSLPDDPRGPSRKAAFGIGMLHGVGVETPTQVVLIVTASSAAGALTGELILVAFTVGLVVANTAIAVAATTGFLQAERRFGVYATIAVATAAFSIALGVLYVAGIDLLPPILTG